MNVTKALHVGRTTKRVSGGAGIGSARSSHVVKKQIAIDDYRGILIGLDAVVPH